MNILGIHDGHNASAVLCKEGCIIAGVQEERLRYEKNWTGFPTRAVKWVLEAGGVDWDEIDDVVLNGHHMPRRMSKAELIADHKIAWKLKPRLKGYLKKGAVGRAYTWIRKRQRVVEAIASGVPAGKIRFVEHHACHASAAYHGWGVYGEPVLVLTCDGSGDRISASVNLGEGGKLKRIASVPETESIGSLYACITTLMGFVPLEHEYKLMGMAPYAPKADAEAIAQVFWRHFFLDQDSLTWRRRIKCPPPYYGYWYWRDVFEGMRFDSVMGGLQLFLEQMLTAWVSCCVRKTGVRKVALSGGVFMNVKANRAIMKLPEVEDIFVFPSCGDEMNTVGACYAVMSERGLGTDIPPLRGVYWGPEYTADVIRSAIEGHNDRRQFLAEECHSINAKVASLLAGGNVVARFAGPEEMGARALGNRSILADPTCRGVVRLINDMIKNRDFWMPFACSVKAERASEYIINEKNIAAPYMIMAFDTAQRGREELGAGIHPYDGTVRPHVVERDWNPSFWDLLSHFEKLTGRGGVLNTSFNLHGFPIVHTPEQALDVLVHSGLEYLQLGNFLVSKVEGC